MITVTRASAKQKVLKVIEDSEIELTPKEIAARAHVNYNTARVYVRQLLAENKIVQPYPTTYCSTITHSMIVSPLRVHNVILSAAAPWLDFTDDVVEWTGDVKVRAQFGLQRKRVTARISCENGMDRNSALFAMQRFYDIVKERSGHDIDSVTIKTFEVNRDKQGFRVDPVKSCFTWKGFTEVLQRVYQKEDDKVRLEHKVSKGMPVDQFVALLQGGVSTYTQAQAMNILVNKVSSLIDAVKFNNRLLLEHIRKEKE